MDFYEFQKRKDEADDVTKFMADLAIVRFKILPPDGFIVGYYNGKKVYAENGKTIPPGTNVVRL